MASKEGSSFGLVWQEAVARYQQNTKHDISSLARANSVEDILVEINNHAEKFGKKRHNNSKLDKFRSLVSESLMPIQVMTDMVSSVLSDAFPASTAIFTAVRYMIGTASRVSADYDRLSEFFQDLMFYLSCFKTIDVNTSPGLGLDAALASVLASVLDLCGICAKFTRTSRLVKAWRNLQGNDKELAAAYGHFHKMVERAKTKVTLISGVGVSDLHHNMTGIKRADTLESLSTHDVLSTQRQKFSQHHNGTCEWVVRHEAFQNWLTGTKDSSLWCFGDHGSGKTTLTSYLINHLSESTQGSNTALAYIYCSYKDESTQSTDEMLASLTRQLAEQVNHVPPALKEFVEQQATKKRKPKGEEWIALIQALRDCHSQAIIIIDALDECPDIVKDELLEFLKLLDTSVRFIFTSRPHIDFPVEFAGLQKIRITADPLDLRVFLEAEISKNRRFKQKVVKNDDVLLEKIVHGIIMKSKGMFLLARMHVMKICSQVSKAAVIKTLNTLPQDIFQFYHEAVERIQQQDEEHCDLANQVISFIAHAKRPLHVQELQHALAVLPDDTEFDESQCVDDELLISLCDGLVQVDETRQIVEFVHYTFQEYCDKFPSKFSEDFASKIAEVCLVYLSFSEFDSGPCPDGDALEKRLADHAFFAYAAQNWGHHMRASVRDLTQLALKYLRSPMKVSSGIQALYATSRRLKDWFDQYPTEVGPLHMASYWGLESLVTVFLEEGLDPVIRTTYGDTPLLLAARNDHLGAVKLLIKHGVDVDEPGYSGETALSLAARKGSEDLVRFLLSSGANLIGDEEGWTPINWAILFGSTAALELILAHTFKEDIDVDIKNKGLLFAAEEGRLEIVRALLNSGADRNAADDWGSRALDSAVAGGYEEIVRELLSGPCDIDYTDKDGDAALHWAVAHENIVILLLDHGAQVDHQNNAGQTALHWAARDGLTEVARLLVERNADLSIQDKNGATALHRAALQGHDQIVDLLLQRGADKTIEDVDGWTPLYSAAINEHAAVCDLLSDNPNDGKCNMDTITKKSTEPRNWKRAKKLASKKSEGTTFLTGLRAAAQEGQLGRLQTLLEGGADVNERDPAGYTALEMAVNRGNSDIVKFLLDSGAGPNVRCSSNCTPLHVAAERQNATIAKILIKHGADVNADDDGTTPLMILAKSKCINGMGRNLMCDDLLRAKADVNRQDSDGQTALHMVVPEKFSAILTKLLEAKADVHCKDYDGKTALQIAVFTKNRGGQRQLLEAGAVPENSDEATLHSESEDLDDPEFDMWGITDPVGEYIPVRPWPYDGPDP